ncbi:MAG: DNA polymerase III subunit beta, partial [Candidatus Portnoybacteria bacterium]|nr:DNA polymerase III subunit beta [Candidatus Portnoybacteria bacterium]
MKIICLQKNLKKGLDIAQNIVGKNLTLPILNNILLSAEKKKLKISATDLEIAITTNIPCKVDKEGSITIPSKTLVSFVNYLPDKKIEVNVKGSDAQLKCENYKSNIKGLNAKDFPIIPKIKGKPILKIKSSTFKSALDQVINFVSFSDIRPEISGILVNFNKKLKLVATDSFRLGEKIIELKKNKSKDSFSFILPYKTAQELARILDDEDDEISITVEDNQVLFELSETKIISKLIEGNYPNYQQLISKEFETKISIDREELLKAVKLSSLFSSKINDVRIKVDPKKSKVEISSQDADLGENTSNIDAEVKGKDVEIIFNYRYILEGLNNINSKKVFLGFNGSESPGVIKPETDSTFTYI